MGLNPVIVRHLQEARRELVQQRDAIDHDIKNIDDMLAESGAEVKQDSVEAPTGLEHMTEQARRNAFLHGKAGVGRGQPAIKDAIRDFVVHQQHPVRTQKIAETLAKDYHWAEASIRSQVSRMARDGEIVGVRRGMYTATLDEPQSMLQDASPPDAAEDRPPEHAAEERVSTPT